MLSRTLFVGASSEECLTCSMNHDDEPGAGPSALKNAGAEIIGRYGERSRSLLKLSSPDTVEK